MYRRSSQKNNNMMYDYDIEWWSLFDTFEFTKYIFINYSVDSSYNHIYHIPVFNFEYIPGIMSYYRTHSVIYFILNAVMSSNIAHLQNYSRSGCIRPKRFSH